MLDFFCRSSSIQISSLGKITISILVYFSICNYKIVAVQANEAIIKSPPIADLNDYFLGEPPKEVIVQNIFTKNDVAGVGVAQPFILNEVGNATQTNFEAFYNIPINKNVRITPVFQVISNPANQSSNETITTVQSAQSFHFSAKWSIVPLLR